jgi:hypothetical protein
MENKFNIDFDKSTHKIGSGLISVPLTVLAGKLGTFVYKRIVIKVVEKKLLK